ncbi:Glycosyltransferase involved in cell wall bisynthesis [Pseudonocardia thermophila]|jgi:Glycosyltransferase|uniref:Glycosyltransferase involved in cell wall bisynthesis n=1 Tax=Pseudonocardia thermophila TaxID=1848 RepID=A0A1M6YTY0_PSETH|nr:glycosyltransferase [Pseudonocardia thermophila]SHL21698.1 Glycosyltransferase involved in cell wall bisynthesis [Pseudonocardia thermophila]
MIRRIAVVTPYYPPDLGGVQRYAERIAHAARDAPDLDPVVVTTGEGPELVDGVQVVRLPVWRRISDTPVHPLWVRQLARLFRGLDVDVVNTHAPVPYLADVAALAAGSRPVVAAYHAGSMVKGVPGIDQLLRAYERLVLPMTFRRADALVAVSPTSLAHGRPGAVTITPGVDVDAFPPSPQPSGDTLLYVGRLDRASAWKGVDVLLRAFASVVAQRPTARLEIVGNGDARPDHEALAVELGIADAVRFAGALHGPQLAAAYAGARALVLPSLTEAESFGMTLVEAMASARPVVGSAVGGIPHVVDDGRTGLLVPPGDVTALAAALVRLLDDPALCARLGEAGRATAVERYAWPRLTERWLALFRGVTRRGARPVSARGAGR